MNTSNLRKIIREVILKMDCPFNVTDLFYELENLYQINDRALILKILDELCESGLLDYSEVRADCWAFEVIQNNFRQPITV